MKRHSFFRRLFLGNLFLVIAIISLGGVVSYRWLNEHYRQESQLAQEQMLHVLHDHFQGLCPFPPELVRARAMIDPQCKDFVRGSDMRLTVVAADGTVLGDSGTDPAAMANHRTDDRPELIQALDGQPGIHIRYSDTLQAMFRYDALPLRHNDRVVGAVRLAVPVKTLLQQEKFLRHTLFWAALASVLVAVVLALLMSWVWYRPLRQITQAAHTIAAGNLSQRARLPGTTELAGLGTALNQMRANLASQIDLIEAQRHNLQTVLANLREAVIALDSDARIVLMNRSAVELLAPEAKVVEGQLFQAVVRFADLMDIYNEATAGAGPVDRQVEVELRGRRKTLDVHAGTVQEGHAGGIRTILVLRDVTELARAAAMKAEFVANASHELRTPLATIRAAVESLEAGGRDDPEAFAKFVAILNRHVARLEEMTQDLLDLHRVERAREQLRLEEADPPSLAQWAQGHFAEQADQKGVKLAVHAAGSSRPFRSDAMLIHLILQNLVDNAIKFTPAGGTVECILEGQDTDLLVRVRDTGCGIPQQLRDRVFERFFQVDPSRAGDSRTRGTGLGLAIVKHATERLGGKVTLESELGAGTTVTVRVPKR